MKVIGLTGSIAMGKTTTSNIFRKLGYEVFDADRVVHQFYQKGGQAALEIGQLLPEVIVDGAVDRNRLAAKVSKDKLLLAKIEKIVHPLVRQKEKDFIARQKRQGAQIAILDIPLLFETNRQNELDFVVVVTTSSDIQKQRAMARPGMTREKLDMILKRQMPDNEKRKRAKFVVDTSVSIQDACEQVKEIMKRLDGSNPNLEISCAKLF